MKRINWNFTALLLVIAALSSFSTGAAANKDIGAAVDDTAAFVMERVTAPGIGQTGGDWAVFALMRSGVSLPDGYVQDYYEKVAAQLAAARGILSTVKYSEYSRVALAAIAIGADPRDIGGYDVIAPLLDYDGTVRQGINGPVFALITLAAAGVEKTPVADRYIEYILSRQLEDGGFTLSGAISDPDTTAMAVTALAYYKDRTYIADAIGRAIERLSRMQRTTGGFTSFSSTNSESVAQVIIALCTLGVSMDDVRFVKEGNTLPDNLLTYYTPGQGFEHERGGGMSLMSTEQALCALAAIKRMQSGENALYDLSDAPGFRQNAPKAGLPGKHPDVKVPDVTSILDASFLPDSTISRAEFVKTIVRVLGLNSDDAEIPFKDVPNDGFFTEYARAAYAYGIILGRSADVFDPDREITRQEAAVMISRAASLCGMDVKLDATAIRNILAPFADYRTAAPWASESLAFCCYSGILDDSAIELKPKEQMTWSAGAEMIYRMLIKAKLL